MELPLTLGVVCRLETVRQLLAENQTLVNAPHLSVYSIRAASID